ncbi:MAG: adenylate/guanylate cyclase domain-containing protein [Chloroflexi bacterium]|nr:MAG: adenylate/guanylate cyclase domain-containing protein [Chloroflexota bacterium]
MHNLVKHPTTYRKMAQQPPAGVVTVLFTDIVGSAALKTSQGDAAAQEIVRGHFDLLRHQVESHGGREVKTLGDGLMATFVSPRNALTSAIAMQRALADGNRTKPPEQQVQVRVGLNAGEAIHEDGDIFGSTVDAAARICAKAAGGQILASETVRGILGSARDLQFRDRGRFRLKGFPERGARRGSRPRGAHPLRRPRCRARRAPPAHGAGDRRPRLDRPHPRRARRGQDKACAGAGARGTQGRHVRCHRALLRDGRRAPLHPVHRNAPAVPTPRASRLPHRSR